MTYERIDVDWIYTHLMWSYWFSIYLIVSLVGVYIIWTDLKGLRGRK